MKILSAKEFTYSYQVNGADLDPFGHMNNARYSTLYEIARWDFIEKNGFGLDKIRSEMKGPVLLNANIQFRREIKNLDQIQIISKASRVEGKYMFLNQSMTREGELCSRAEFMVGFFDLKERKLIAANQEWFDACGIIIE